jgi:hypothetical protein
MTLIEKITSILKNYMASKENVKFAYLFGSYAENRERKDSDIDVAVYLFGIHEDDFFKYKLDLKTELEQIFKKPVDVVIVNNASPLLNHEVFKNGIIVKNSEPSILSQFRAKNFYYYIDQMYIINTYFKYTKEKIRMRLTDG